MHLVLDLCQHLEKFALYVHGYCLRWEAEEQFVGAVAVVFCQSGNRNRQVKLAFGDFPHHVHLPFTTIGDDEVGQGLLFLHHAAVSPSDHLLHGRVVVGTDHGFDIIFPIVLPRGLHTFIYDAAGNGVGARDVAVVETFYLVGQLLHAQKLLQLFHQSCLLLFRIQFFGLFQPVKLILLAIHLRNFEQMLLVAALWDKELSILDLPIHLEGDNDFLGLTVEAFPDFGYG